MKRIFRKPMATVRTAAAGTLLLGSLLSTPTAFTARAADPYDKKLEDRVEALERELNAMSNDSKGKNVTNTTEVPTFVRASKNVQELVFSGEVRFRQEYGIQGSQINGTSAQEDRNRFRFRLFADYKLNDQFFAGGAVQTAIAADSGNTTVSEGFDNYSLYLWRFFVGWKSKDDTVKIIAGKQPNPFYEETEMLWDADISPYGLTEQYKLTISPQLEFGLVAGQFYFYDNNENSFENGNTAATTVNGGKNNEDAYLFYQQVTASVKPTNNLTVTGAAGYMFYGLHGGTASGTAINPAAGNAAATGPGIGATGVVGAGNGQGQAANVLQNTAAFNSANATRDLSLGTFNGDVKTGFGPIKLKVYGQAVYNFTGGSRDRHEYNQPGLDSTTDKIAFAAGVTIGSDYQIKKKGDYVLLAEYRQVGLGSVDPNLNDSDFNFSRLGFRGVKAAASYGFTPYIITSLTYFGSNNLGSEKNLNIGVGNYNYAHLFQFDVTFKF